VTHATTDRCVLAVDIGGTGMKAALVDASGELLRSEIWPTDAGRGPESVLDNLLDRSAELVAWSARPVAAVGLAVPGLVDARNGIARWSANVGWSELSVRDIASERLGLPVVIGHDVGLGGLAEARLGAGRGVDDLLFVAIGTGIAAAILAGGELIIGGAGQAGEIGHVRVDGHTEPCACGAVGCLETVASAAAIARRFVALGGPPGTDAAGVVARLGSDPIADAVWSEAIAALSSVLSASVTLLAPDRVIIGGGLAAAGEQLLDPIRRELAVRRTVQPLPEIVPAQLGRQAGCRGAGLIAWDLLHDEIDS